MALTYFAFSGYTLGELEDAFYIEEEEPMDIDFQEEEPMDHDDLLAFQGCETWEECRARLNLTVVVNGTIKQEQQSASTYELLVSDNEIIDLTDSMEPGEIFDEIFAIEVIDLREEA